MTYKCIPFSGGVAVTLHPSAYFVYNLGTHHVTDLGGGFVRIGRRFDNYIELLREPISAFVDGNNNPVATTFAALDAFFNTERSTQQIQNLLDGLTDKDMELAGLITDLQADFATVQAQSAAVATRMDSVETAVSTLTAPVAALEAGQAALELLVQEVASTNSGHATEIDNLQTASSSADTRLGVLETAMPLKADLVAGKIPMSQLPDLPVGRKVSVADSADRLALPIHGDLTIAYQVDTADAWVLDANEDPAEEANWVLLGSAQGTGVASFKGRTGNVMPTAGDYTADQITETAGKTFVAAVDRARWDDKASPQNVVDAVAGLRTESDTNFLRKSQRGIAGGVASLGSDGLVLSSQLPPQGLTSAQAQRLNDVESLASLANQKGDISAENILAVDRRLTQVDTDLKAAVAQAKSSSIPTAQRGANNGVATLDATGKVPAAQLPVLSGDYIPTSQKAAANGVAPLGADGKVPAAHLPEGLGTEVALLNYQYATVTRNANTWYTNDSDYPLILHVVFGWGSDGASSSVSIRNKSTDTSFFVMESSLGTSNHTQQLTVIVPARGAYRIVPGTNHPLYSVRIGTQTVSSTFVPDSQKGIANGVAPLDANSKVPLANLPDMVPKARVWRDNKRAYNTWATNDTGADMELYIRTNAITEADVYININIRNGPTGATMTFASTAETSSGGNRYLTHQLTIPAGWQFGVSLPGGGTYNIGHIGIWRELS